MTPQSSESPEFLGTLQAWIAEAGEILLVIRYAGAGGSKSFEFFSSFEACRERISKCGPQTSLIAFHSPQLTLRGTVDDAFIEAALSMVPEGAEYLVAGLEMVQHGALSWLENWAGERHDELREDLGDNRGTRVAFGPYPPWWEDREDVASAVVPMPDGSIEYGAY